MEAYKRWVRRNKDYVHSLESMANGLTWLLPERFSNSEIGPEAVTTFLGIITAINGHIIDSAPTDVHTNSTHTSFPYSLCISALKDLETLVEVVAEHFVGNEKKWNCIAITEATKMLFRLALFHNNGYKMLLHGGEIPNVENNADASSSQNCSGGFTKPSRHHGDCYSQGYPGQNPRNLEGRAMSALTRFGENARMVSDPTWLRRFQQQQAIMVTPTPVVERPTLSSTLSEKGLPGVLFVMGEVLFITRPFIYVLFIIKHGCRSWHPWFISFFVELLGMGITSYATRSGKNGKHKEFHVSDSENNELKRRKLLLALYLMRDPFFSKYTRKRLESAQIVLEPVPIIGFVAEKIMELLTGAQTRYTYTSGS